MEVNEKCPINIIIFENGNKPYGFLGKILKDFRISRGFTFADLAFIMNTTLKSLKDIEEGNFDPSSLILVDRLACLYHINFHISYEKLQ